MPITTTPSGGPQGEFSTYTPIYSQTLSSNTSSITFSNIPTTFTDLVLVGNCGDTANAGIYMQFNGDTSTNYSYTRITGEGTAASSQRGSTTAKTYVLGASITIPASVTGTFTVNLMNYSNPSVYKTSIGKEGIAGSGVVGKAFLWRSLSPITSITIADDGGSILSGSSFTLYGIKAAATQFTPSKASGGDIVATDGTYAYHAFTSTGTFKPAQSLTADILVIAGGASGGNGGGGAGGLLAYTSQSLTSINYTVTVGAGGAVGLVSGNGVNGNNSQFGALTAATGGGKGAYTGAAAIGGSGGGGASNGAGGTAAGAAPTSGQGSAGGTGASGGTNSGGGGGGGATAVGGNGTAGVAGAGGAGSSAYSSWGLATNTGQNVSGTYWYAGGGGGGAGGTNSPITPGAGGSGGGGFGGNSRGALGGGFATGGGGGGIYDNDPSGAGGSGIVIVRYTL